MQIRVTIGPTFSSISYLDLSFQMMAIKYVTAMTSLIKSGTITTYAPLLPNVLKKDTLQVVPVFIASLIPGNNSPGFNWSSRQTAHWSAIFEQHSRPQSPHWRRQNCIGAGEDGSVSKIGNAILQRNFPRLRGFRALDGWLLGRCIRHFSSTIHHSAGTCEMDPSTDPSDVVDPELKVYNISRVLEWWMHLLCLI